MSHRGIHLFCTLSLVALGASLASAQDATAPQRPNASDTGEIIVTAQRRSEDVKKVPSSISVLGGATLARAQITGVEDISRAVPGLSFSAGGGPGLDNIEIRGISSTSGSATVGLYLDDVPITLKNRYNGAVEPRFLDFDRVEVLRGPQGTLFGASSMGGTIRYLSNQPDLTKFSLTASSEQSGTKAGGFNYDEQAVVNAPISNRLAVRVGFDVGRDDGWIDNYDLSGKRAAKNTNFNRFVAMKAAARFAVDDSFTITPSVFYEAEKSGDTSIFYPDLGLYKQAKEVREPSNDKLVVASLTLNKDLGFAQLTSISGFFHQRFARTQDGTVYNSQYLGELVDDDPPNGIQGQGYQIGLLPGPEYSLSRTSTLSQEVRLASSKSFSEKLSWVAGFYYSNYTTHYAINPFVTGLDATFQRIYGIPIQDSDVFAGETFPDDSVGPYRAHVNEIQYAGFVDASYVPLPGLKLSAGVRYSHTPYTYSESATGFFSAPSVRQKATFNSPTPRFAATYDVSQELTLYATASKGYRVGGAEGYIPPDLCGPDFKRLGFGDTPTTYDSDSLWNYEGGAKGRFLNNHLTINADFYYVKWSKIQQSIPLPTCGYALTTNVGNAASYGPEVEFSVRPIDDLTLGASGSYTHAELTSVTSAVGASVGEQILGVPKWMATFRVEYTHKFTNETGIFARTDYDLTGPSHGAFDVSDPDYKRPTYGVLNATVGASRGRFEISIFGKNVLDSKKIIQHPSLLYVNEAYTLRPLTVGVRLKAKI